MKFKQKIFTLQEGHYTGTKDLEEVPGLLKTAGKGLVSGAIAGGIVGAVRDDSTALKGAKTGAKWGMITGITFKIFLNYLHNPMTKVKYQEVDRMIRKEFGIYSSSGITVGDSLKKRDSLDDKFSFNDRDVTKYKISFSIQDNKITMYTFKLTKNEVECVDEVLDYYCKKYSGMRYSSSILNKRYNAYSASIVFTNYQAISNFIMDLSDILKTKINLLDNKALVQDKISEYEGEEEEKEFSVKDINKYDFIKILGKTTSLISMSALSKTSKQSIGNAVMSLLYGTSEKLGKDILVMGGLKMPREDFSNKYLEDTLKKLHYFERIHYFVNRSDIKSNMSMICGRLVITVPEGKDQKAVDKEFWEHLKTKVNRSYSSQNKVAIYSYLIESRKDFEYILNKLMSTGVIFNIFEG